MDFPIPFGLEARDQKPDTGHRPGPGLWRMTTCRVQLARQGSEIHFKLAISVAQTWLQTPPSLLESPRAGAGDQGL